MAGKKTEVVGVGKAGIGAARELKLAITYLEDGAAFSALAHAIEACKHLTLLVAARYGRRVDMSITS